MALLILGGAAASAGEAEKRASEEVRWGYKAARRGYWQEALMRFERADGLTPNRPRVLNNLAIALEALGRYEEARGVYERALALAPNDQALRRNHRRFQEFYTEYLAAPEPEEEVAPAGEEASPAAATADAEEGGGHGQE